MIGFSLSPGGLLLPYHMGVLSTLSDKGYITDKTPLAGSSAGMFIRSKRNAQANITSIK